MTLDVLVDNRSCNDLCETEHGLSILLTTGDCRILLDTGASDLLLRNAERIGVKLGEVDYVFISHGHSDHAGGLRHFLKINRKAKLIVSPYAIKGEFYSCRNGEHSITAEWPEDMNDRLIVVDHSCTIDEKLHVIAQIAKEHNLPKANDNLFTVDDQGRKIKDDFRHELALYINGMLFTGCAHSELENILGACSRPVHTVIGGFHLLDGYETEDEQRELAEKLTAKYPNTVFYTSHCTGDHVFENMKEIMAEHLRPFKCGMRIVTRR